jgi:transcriptional regulator with XRE-family HTH domain
MSDVEAAKVLGVSKTVIGDYRRGKSLPGTEVLAKICIHWNLVFNYKGFEISAKNFVPQNGRPKAVSLQLELPFGEPFDFRGLSERVQDVQLTISLRRVS